MAHSFLPIFNHDFSRYVNLIENFKGKPFNIHTFVMENLAKTILSTSFGLPKGEDFKCDVIETGKYLDNFIVRALNPFLHLDFIFKRTKMYQEMTNTLEGWNVSAL